MALALSVIIQSNNGAHKNVIFSEMELQISVCKRIAQSYGSLKTSVNS